MFDLVQEMPCMLYNMNNIANGTKILVGFKKTNNLELAMCLFSLKMSVYSIYYTCVEFTYTQVSKYPRAPQKFMS